MAPGVAAPARLAGARVSDDALVLATRGGSDEAFLVLYDRYRDLAWRVARSTSSNDLDAEDAVAEGFARVYTVLREREVASFQPYLAATVRNAALDVHRRRERPDSDAALAEPPSTDRGVEELALEADESDLVARAFATLPERYRSALWLSEVEGFGTAEVGHVVGTSANGAAALTMRARERLREAYLQEHLRRPLDAACADATSRLATHVRGTASSRAVRKVEDHVGSCRGCAGRLTELRTLNDSLAAAIPAAPATLLAGDRVLDRAVAQGDGLGSADAVSTVGSAPTDSVSRFGDSASLWADAGARLAPYAATSPSITERVFQPVAAAVAGILVAGAASVAGPGHMSDVHDRAVPVVGEPTMPDRLPGTEKAIAGVEVAFERPVSPTPERDIETAERGSSVEDEATDEVAVSRSPEAGDEEAPPSADVPGRRSAPRKPDPKGSGQGEGHGQGGGQSGGPSGGQGIDEAVGGVDDSIEGLLGGPQPAPGEPGPGGPGSGGAGGDNPATGLPKKVPSLDPGPTAPVLDDVDPPPEAVLEPVPVPVTDPEAVVGPAAGGPAPDLGL